MPHPTAPKTTLEHLVILARKLVKGKKYNVPASLRADFKRVLAAHDEETTGPTAYSFLLDDDDFDEKPVSQPRCEYRLCNLPFRPKKEGQRFCRSTCRQLEWHQIKRDEKASNAP